MFSLIDDDMTSEAEELFNLLYTKKFNASVLKKELETGRFSTEDINRAAIDYVLACMEYRWGDKYDGAERQYGETVPGYEDSHVVEALEIMLDFGLDPNKVYNDGSDGSKKGEHWNIMFELWGIGNGYQGADALRLLLQHGGDPNLMLEFNSVTAEATMDLVFEMDEREHINDFAFDAFVHYWLVLNGFGGLMNDKSPLDPVSDFTLSLLRNHRDYYYGEICSDESKLGWQYCIFDRHTNREVARFSI